MASKQIGRVPQHLLRVVIIDGSKLKFAPFHPKRCDLVEDPSVLTPVIG